MRQIDIYDPVIPVADYAAISSINTNATTNGVHTVNSDHYSGNAVDINRINNHTRRGDSYGTTLTLGLQARALADPTARYVEGPGGTQDALRSP